MAEEDLRRRGMGDLLGLRQAGASALAPGGTASDADSLERDLDLLFAARDLVAGDAALRARYARRARRGAAPGA